MIKLKMYVFPKVSNQVQTLSVYNDPLNLCMTWDTLFACKKKKSSYYSWKILTHYTDWKYIVKLVNAWNCYQLMKINLQTKI